MNSAAHASAGNARQRSDRARAALIDATIQLLTEAPADEISITEITKQAAVSRPTFYHHFGTTATAVQAAVLSRLQSAFDTIPARALGVDWTGYARSTFRGLLGELQENASFYRHALQGSAAQALVTAAIDFLTARIQNDSPLTPILERRSAYASPQDQAAFLAAGVAWHVLRWLGTDHTGHNDIENTADRLLALILTAVDGGR